MRVDEDGEAGYGDDVRAPSPYSSLYASSLRPSVAPAIDVWEMLTADGVASSRARTKPAIAAAATINAAPARAYSRRRERPGRADRSPRRAARAAATSSRSRSARPATWPMQWRRRRRMLAAGPA